ncbi:hypothetical protein VTI74DRAFT_5423 [Chaetomium olivicolor]
MFASKGETELALNVMQWVDRVRNNRAIKLRICDATYNPGSGVTHNEYLQLRAVWYHYPQLQHFDALFQDDDAAGYKGYVRKANREQGRLICDQTRPPEWNEYFRAIASHTTVSAPGPASSRFSFVRYWQELVTTHTKNDKKVPDDEVDKMGKVVKPARDSVGALAESLNDLAVSSKSQGKLPVTPVKKSTAMVPEFGTPQVQSFQPGKGGATNKVSSDETYANNALLLLLQAVSLDLPAHFRFLHWAATRIPLRLRDKNKQELMEARVDGYLCRTDATGQFNEVPLAICETKPFVRSAGLKPTQRQEAAEMACWISQGEGDEGLLQMSASGKKRYVACRRR